MPLTNKLVTLVWTFFICFILHASNLDVFLFNCNVNAVTGEQFGTRKISGKVVREQSKIINNGHLKEVEQSKSYNNTLGYRSLCIIFIYLFSSAWYTYKCVLIQMKILKYGKLVLGDIVYQDSSSRHSRHSKRNSLRGAMLDLTYENLKLN